MIGAIFRTFCIPTLLISAQIAAAQLNEVVDVSLVDVYLSALDSENNPVEHLTVNDFVLKEDGVEQKITNFSKLLGDDSQIPLTIVFLVDTSGSMQEGEDKLRRIDIGKKFASLMLSEMKRGDQMQIIAFDNVYRALTPMTDNLAAMNSALAKVNIDTRSNPGTALNYSVNRTIRHLDQFFGRKIMIVCSDGQNNAPGPGADELVDSLKRKDITVLSLAPITSRTFQNARHVFYADAVIRSDVEEENTKEGRKARKLLNRLSEETGGYAFFPDKTSDLDAAIAKIRAIIRSQFALAYKPVSKRRTGWRDIEVKCTRKNVKLRYRKSYFMN